MSDDTSARLIDEARAVARKSEEIASYCHGTDLAERLKHAAEGQEAQRRQLMQASETIQKLVAALEAGRG